MLPHTRTCARPFIQICVTSAWRVNICNDQLHCLPADCSLGLGSSWAARWVSQHTGTPSVDCAAVIVWGRCWLDSHTHLFILDPEKHPQTPPIAPPAQAAGPQELCPRLTLSTFGFTEGHTRYELQPLHRTRHLPLIFLSLPPLTQRTHAQEGGGSQNICVHILISGHQAGIQWKRLLMSALFFWEIIFPLLKKLLFWFFSSRFLLTSRYFSTNAL